MWWGGFRENFCVLKTGLSFLALCSKFHFSLEENCFGFGWVGGLAWVGVRQILPPSSCGQAKPWLRGHQGSTTLAPATCGRSWKRALGLQKPNYHWSVGFTDTLLHQRGGVGVPSCVPCGSWVRHLEFSVRVAGCSKACWQCAIQGDRMHLLGMLGTWAGLRAHQAVVCVDLAAGPVAHPPSILPLTLQ